MLDWSELSPSYLHVFCADWWVGGAWEPHSRTGVSDDQSFNWLLGLLALSLLCSYFWLSSRMSSVISEWKESTSSPSVSSSFTLSFRPFRKPTSFRNSTEYSATLWVPWQRGRRCLAASLPWTRWLDVLLLSGVKQERVVHSSSCLSQAEVAQAKASPLSSRQFCHFPRSRLRYSLSKY